APSPSEVRQRSPQTPPDLRIGGAPLSLLGSFAGSELGKLAVQAGALCCQLVSGDLLVCERRDHPGQPPFDAPLGGVEAPDSPHTLRGNPFRPTGQHRAERFQPLKHSLSGHLVQQLDPSVWSFRTRLRSVSRASPRAADVIPEDEAAVVLRNPCDL